MKEILEVKEKKKKNYYTILMFGRSMLSNVFVQSVARVHFEIGYSDRFKNEATFSVANVVLLAELIFENNFDHHSAGNKNQFRPVLNVNIFIGLVWCTMVQKCPVSRHPCFY